MPGTKDQRDKERKAHLVELNWGCRVQDSVPADIRPHGDSTKRKATLSDGISLPELPWQRWSSDLLNQLQKLSSMTKGKLAFAQELMTLEVRQRQEDMMNPRKTFAEVLRSDLERINKDLKDNMPVEAVEDDNSGSEDEYEDENEQHDQRDDEDNQQAEYDGKDGNMESDQVQIVEDDDAGKTEHIRQESKAEMHDLVDVKKEDASEKAEGRGGAEARAREMTSRTPTQVMVTKSGANLQKQAKILRLRADAMRLKQEAAKRMAEAYELEAKMVLAESKQTDE